jgi:hypothetical protein
MSSPRSRLKCSSRQVCPSWMYPRRMPASGDEKCLPTAQNDGEPHPVPVFTATVRWRRLCRSGMRALRWLGRAYVAAGSAERPTGRAESGQTGASAANSQPSAPEARTAARSQRRLHVRLLLQVAHSGPARHLLRLAHGSPNWRADGPLRTRGHHRERAERSGAVMPRNDRRAGSLRMGAPIWRAPPPRLLRQSGSIHEV